jgi:hypothetical protein
VVIASKLACRQGCEIERIPHNRLLVEAYNSPKWRPPRGALAKRASYVLYGGVYPPPLRSYKGGCIVSR